MEKRPPTTTEALRCFRFVLDWTLTLDEREQRRLAVLLLEQEGARGYTLHGQLHLSVDVGLGLLPRNKRDFQGHA